VPKKFEKAGKVWNRVNRTSAHLSKGSNMRNVFLKIMDKSGNTFTLDVSTPGAGTKVWHGLTVAITDPAPVIGSWKAMEKGFLRYNFGKTRSRLSHNGDRTTRDLLILSVNGVGINAYDDKSEQFGIQLFEYEDWSGVNDEGEGFIIQPWVVSLTPGRIRWEKAGL
jgi:hypothetical protein